MVDTTKAIYDTLSADNTLKAMLASNAPFYDAKGSSDPANSIIPAPLARTNTATPFITIQEGVGSKLSTHLRDESFYIRVYNSPNKAYVEINQIAERMITLLDEKVIGLDNHVMIKSKYESSLATATDEGMNMNFRELRFRIYLL